jgi:cytoskeletal protein RodZ
MSRIVGRKLRKTREAKNLSLEHVESATHIRQRYLEAMEKGDFNALPSPLQVKGFLRSYAGFLGLNADELIEAFDLDPWTAMETLKDDSEIKEIQEEEIIHIDSESNFKKIGQTLQSQRETLVLSLEEVAQYTHLRIPFIKALESGEINNLPSLVQGRGMLSNYASFLGLDTDQILLEYADGLQNRLAEKTPKIEKLPIKRKPKTPQTERKLLSRDLVVGIILALSLVVFIIWGTIEVTSIRAQETLEPTAPSIAEVLLPSPTQPFIPTSTPIQQSPSTNDTETRENVEEVAVEETQEVVNISAISEGPIQVQVVARQRAWMRITVDGEVQYDGRIIPGTIYGFVGEEYIEISTGNGAGLQVIYNNLDIGTLGNLGEIINFVITINGIQTPTPTITLTPTVTETETPEGSLTLTP